MADENLPDSDPCEKQAAELEKLTKRLRQWHFVNRFPIAGFNYQGHIDSMDVKETRSDTTNPTGIIKRFYKCKQDNKFICDYSMQCFITLSEAVFYDKSYHNHEEKRHPDETFAEPRSKRTSRKPTDGSAASKKKKTNAAASDNSVVINLTKPNSAPTTGFSVADFMNEAPSNVVHLFSIASIAAIPEKTGRLPPSLKTVNLPTPDATVAESRKASVRPKTGFSIADLIGVAPSPSSSGQTVDSNKENDVMPFNSDESQKNVNLDSEKPNQSISR